MYPCFADNKKKEFTNHNSLTMPTQLLKELDKTEKVSVIGNIGILDLKPHLNPCPVIAICQHCVCLTF